MPARPKYYSDGDTRPTYRGYFYAVVQRTGATWAVLTLYMASTVWAAIGGKYSAGGLICRSLHTLMLSANALLSDELHNLDQRLGRAYAKPAGPLPANPSRLCWVLQHYGPGGPKTVAAYERCVHAVDWLAAAGVPLTYHCLLYFGLMSADERGNQVDEALVSAHMLAFFVLCVRVSPDRLKELFGHFVATFGQVRRNAGGGRHRGRRATQAPAGACKQPSVCP